MRRAWAGFWDWLLGPRCHYCETRVFTKDTVAHYRVCTRTSA